ncbi:hypothetical protein KI809_03750 [Geobacter pelophilus]|uniref:N-acetyltransferase domain-containing protein n=1 Tax=Geoanaerobacter pelophilus TaxID=60036 RepID=A0AAW4KZQ7_9BACT|nr:hypothetical protein [Geoanaerobacter pelophilus]MBT0663407.1 hypothetical protein [Geoanaerobacter pelophilus]
MSEIRCLREIPWETRNLGVKSFAITEDFITNPDQAILQDTITRNTLEFGSIFIQARIGQPDRGTVQLLEQAGFYFVETALVPYSIFKNNDVLSRFVVDMSGFYPDWYDLCDLHVFTINKSDSALRSEVMDIAGESFVADRFHLDFKCSKKIADRRYIYWVDDMLGDKTITFDVLQYIGKTVAFMARKESSILLAGVSTQYINSGLGSFFWLSVLKQMMNEGFTQVNSMISANNMPVLNMFARIGFKFKNPSVTLHYWSPGDLTG